MNKQKLKEELTGVQKHIEELIKEPELSEKHLENLETRLDDVKKKSAGAEGIDSKTGEKISGLNLRYKESHIRKFGRKSFEMYSGTKQNILGYMAAEDFSHTNVADILKDLDTQIEEIKKEIS